MRACTTVQSVDLPGKLRLGHAVKDKDDIRYSTFADTFFQHRARDLAARTCPARQFQHAHFQRQSRSVPILEMFCKRRDHERTPVFGGSPRAARMPSDSQVLARLTRKAIKGVPICPIEHPPSNIQQSNSQAPTSNPTQLVLSTDTATSTPTPCFPQYTSLASWLPVTALASPVALAPRGFYSSYNNNGLKTDMGHTDATSVTPYGGNTATSDYNNRSGFQNSGTSYGIDPTGQFPGPAPGPLLGAGQPAFGQNTGFGATPVGIPQSFAAGQPGFGQNTGLGATPVGIPQSFGAAQPGFGPTTGF
ncbi:hypothetical protein MJO29_009802 [Puccinia striiformis f. sp. tritici]|nr:hypothetical protein MJO29_009802 [Puccinia striiformis f. sp. tritici]